MAYEGMIAETLSINGDKHQPISAYVARPLGSGARSPAWCSSITCPDGTSGSLKRPANSRITVTQRFVTTSITAPAKANPTTSPPRCAPRAAWPTRKLSATPKARWHGCVPQPWLNGLRRRACYLAPAAARPSCSPATPKASTPRADSQGRPRSDEQRRINTETAGRPDRVHQKSVLPLLGYVRQRGSRAHPGTGGIQHEAELKKYGKNYEFHRYDGAGHGFFYYDRPIHRIEQPVRWDGWQKVFTFLKKLGTSRLAAACAPRSSKSSAPTVLAGGRMGGSNSPTQWVTHDHLHHALLEEAITPDFCKFRTFVLSARVAVELTLSCGYDLSDARPGHRCCRSRGRRACARHRSGQRRNVRSRSRQCWRHYTQGDTTSQPGAPRMNRTLIAALLPCCSRPRPPPPVRCGSTAPAA